MFKLGKIHSSRDRLLEELTVYYIYEVSSNLSAVIQVRLRGGFARIDEQYWSKLGLYYLKDLRSLPNIYIRLTSPTTPGSAVSESM